MITFEEIGADNRWTQLSVTDEQQQYMATPSEIMEDATEDCAEQRHVYYIMNDATPVGMIFYSDFPVLNAYNLCQVFIDHRYQRKGYGRQAISLALSMMSKEAKYPQVYVSYINGNETARKLYESFGFAHTGYEFEGTIDMRRDLPYTK